MHVEFQSIKFRNILSYGNKWTEMNFSSGLNLIKASNGSGKSTILDAINFCLFGKPFRNIKIGQLINKYNKKNLVVNMKFKIGLDQYEITRGIKPDVFMLSKNGEDIESMSSKRLNQEEIEKLLGINERLFKYIVGIAVTNSKPFLTMSIGDKRSLIESIFNIDVLSLMAKEVKKRNSMSESDLRLKITENTGVENSIKDNTDYIKKIEKYAEQFDENKKATCNELVRVIKQYEEAIEKQNGNIIKGNNAIEKASKDAVEPSTDEFIKINTELGAIQHTQKTIEKKLSKINDETYCPLCGAELDEGHAKKHIDELKTELAEIENIKLPKLLEEQKILNNKKKEYDEVQSKINLIKQKVVAEQVKLANNQTQLSKLKDQLETEKNKVCDFKVDDYKTKLSDLKERAKTLADEIEKIQHKIKVDTKIIDILGDEGLRMYFFKKLLPVLNNRINHYLKKFELSATLELDPSMNETIMTGRFEQSYNNFSGGEKARIDMAILLSFFDISKMISNWSCSLLFVDEVMDGGVDNNGIEQFLGTFYSIVSEQDKNIGIYIISHKLSDVQINWSNIIEIEKKSMFSELKVSK